MRRRLVGRPIELLAAEVLSKVGRVMRSRRLAGLMAAIVTAGYLLAGPVAPALAACAKEEAGAIFTPSTTVVGAKMEWRARTLVASDWSASYQGFAAEVLWVGTDDLSPSTKWVEAGVTQGWEGSNILTFYTAHGGLHRQPARIRLRRLPDRFR